MARIWLSLGSNLGDRLGHLTWGVNALAPCVVVVAVSGLWETAPMYVTDQPSFLNLALEGETALGPLQLLACLKTLERQAGRSPGGERYGPRPLDMDILFYEDQQWDTQELCLPHPRLAERAFVLHPLAEIAPDLRHPMTGNRIADLRDRLDRSEDAANGLESERGLVRLGAFPVLLTSP